MRERKSALAHGCAWLGGALLASTGSAFAQSFPTKPIRFIAAFPAGGPSDIVARAIGRRMSEVLGQAVVIDNRTGAGGNIGAEVVAKPPPDGHTLLLGGSFVTIAPSLYAKPPFDPVRDFAPISLIVSNQYVLVIHPSVPARNVKDLIKLAKAQPGKLNYASTGPGSPPRLCGELFKSMAGIDMVNITYKAGTDRHDRRSYRCLFRRHFRHIAADRQCQGPAAGRYQQPALVAIARDTDRSRGSVTRL